MARWGLKFAQESGHRCPGKRHDNAPCARTYTPPPIGRRPEPSPSSMGSQIYMSQAGTVKTGKTIGVAF
jgi:hypothetical protein